MKTLALLSVAAGGEQLAPASAAASDAVVARRLPHDPCVKYGRIRVASYPFTIRGVMKSSSSAFSLRTELLRKR